MGRVSRTARARGTAAANGRGHRRSLRRTLAAIVAAAAFAGVSLPGIAAATPGEEGGLAPRPDPLSRGEVEAAINRALATERVALRRGSVIPGMGPPGKRAAAFKGVRRSLFPRNRVVSLYGLPGGFGALGRKSARGARRRLAKQAHDYRRRGKRPVIRAFDMVATVPTSCSGRRDKCRFRVPDRLVRRYLREVRRFNGRLLLDIGLGRSTYMNEFEHWRNFLLEPDVGIAIDPEWDVGPHGEPGETVGSSNARQVNRLSHRMQHLIREHRLPSKLLVVHQFRPSSVKRQDDIKRRPKVDITLNFDGIGAPPPKRRGYRRLAERRLFNGFSLFYQLDSNLMSPRQVLRLRPRVDYVMYQ
jgi:hypothetical protein